MLENVGRKAVALAVALPLLLALVFGVAMAPMLVMVPTDVPFAVVTLDEGADTFAGPTNVGETLVGNLLNGEGLDTGASSGTYRDSNGEYYNPAAMATIKWTQLASQEELEAAMSANEFYGGVVIPADFTSQQMLSTTGLGGTPKLTVYLNGAKNPMLVMMMRPTLQSLMLQSGVSTEFEMVNYPNVGGSTSAPMMSIQVSAMPPITMSLVISLTLWPKRPARRRERAKATVQQVAGIAVVSLVIALATMAIDHFAGGLDIPYGNLIPLIWLCAASMMAVLVGLADLWLPLAYIVGMGVFALGMTCSILTPELLPQFWVDWVYPWVPQRTLGDGLRNVIFMGGGPFDTGLARSLATAAVGVAVMAVAAVLPQRDRDDGKDEEGQSGKMSARAGSEA